nr:polyprenyl synthetase family protein [Propioniferax innocua]
MEGRLDSIEQRLLTASEADTRLVTEAAQHIISAGGKRFRPMLVVLCAHLADAEGAAVDADRLEKAALVVELTHVASLYHDDVMDDADLRRGAVAANRRWQNSVAILVGDYLFARASDTVAELGTDYVQIQARTFARLVQGQIAETVGPVPDADPIAHHLQVIADKTGSLIATSAVFGGMVAGFDEETLEVLRDFGEEIGLVFQLHDDIIDITSDVTGKTPGTDLREGIPTLPTLLARAMDRPEDERLFALVDSDLESEEDLAEAVRLLREHPAIEEARTEVRRRADAARARLQVLPAGPAREALEALCDHVINRDD